MPESRRPNDPFTDGAPLRATTSNTSSLSTHPTLRDQTSQHSLRSNASAASSRVRQPRELFAPSLTRRGTTPRFEDEVFADTDSEQDLPTRRQRPARRTRHGSPEGRYNRAKSKQDEDRDFLNRQSDGSYLLGVAGFGGDSLAIPAVNPSKTEEELNQEEADAHYGAMARHFFTSGPGPAHKHSKKHEEELEQYRAPMMMRLKERVVQQLEDERWRIYSIQRDWVLSDGAGILSDRARGVVRTVFKTDQV